MKQKLHKKRGLHSLAGAAAFFLLCGLSAPAPATVLLTDNFMYDTGNLLGQGEWKSQDPTASPVVLPIQVVDTALTYPGYQENPVGKAVRIDNKGEDLYKEFTPAITSGSVYFSALIHLEDAQSKSTQGEYFLHFGEGGGTTMYNGRLMAKKSDNGKLVLGITRGGTSSITVWDENEYELNTTLLVVIKYTFVDGNKMNKASLFINPVIDGDEPEPNVTSGTETGAQLTKAGSISIRQGAGSRTPLGVIDAVRVATTWGELFPGDVPPLPVPVIAVNPARPYFGAVFAGETYTATVNIKATNLTENIRIDVADGSELSTAVSSIEKSDAESDAGFDLVLTLNPVSEETYTDTLILTTAGTEPVKVALMWSTTAAIPVANIGELRQVDLSDPATARATYKLVGECLVSHVFKDDDKKYIYIQDHTSAITVQDQYNDIVTEYAAGDRLVNLYVTLESIFGTLFALPAVDFGAPVSQNNEIIPQEVTLAELAANPTNYESRLVTVKGIAFFNRENENGGIFTEGTNNKISQDGTEATMRVFKGADFIGQAIPAKADLTGIPTASSGKLVAPRSAADIVEVTDQPATPKSLVADFNDGLPEGWEKQAGWEYRSDEGVDGTGCMYIEGPSDYNLTSPTIDLSAGGYTLTYDYKWIPMGDWEEEAEVNVMISSDNGQSFSKLGKWKRANSFTEASFDLAAYTSPTTKIRFAFAITNPAGWTEGGTGWLDNLKLTSELVSIENQEADELTVAQYPGHICITAPQTITSVRITNLSGQLLLDARNTDDCSYETPAGILSPGIYLLEVTSGGNKTVRKIAIGR